MNFEIGYAQEIITPPLAHPVYLAGFGQNRKAQSIHDDLFVRALSISDGRETIVLVALDLIGFFRPDVLDVLQKTSEVLKASEVLPKIVIASTHTHHGPDTMGLWGPDDKTRGVDVGYLSDTKEKIVKAILASLSDPQPAAVKSTSVRVPGLARNARNPEIVDEELTLAQFVDSMGRPLASLFNFPCHPEVLWEHNPHITSDYVGYLRTEAERVTNAPCIFFSGALGGMMTPDVRDHSFDEAEFMGNKLADEGLKSLSAASSDPSPTIGIQTREVKVKLTNILFKLAFRRKLLPDVRDGKGRITTEVNLIKIGRLWLATVPGEMLPKLGLALKAKLRESGAGVAGIVGLANDELGYILPKEDHRYPFNPFNPGKHYEETMSISKEIGSKVMMAAFELLT